MRPEVKSFLAEEGGKFISEIARAILARPKQVVIDSFVGNTSTAVIEKPQPKPQVLTLAPVIKVKQLEQVNPSSNAPQDLDYRWECTLKHLGGASILLREAYERAVDGGMGDGTAEKFMEAMNEHSGSESDIEKMLGMPDAKDSAEKLMGGIKAFRNAAWKAKLPVGGGTVQDIADARLWNNLLLQEAYSQAKKQPGNSCVLDGNKKEE
jgi:hypothetical protein